MDPEDLDIDGTFADGEMKKALTDRGLGVMGSAGYEAFFEAWIAVKKKGSQK